MWLLNFAIQMTNQNPVGGAYWQINQIADIFK
jgi:hypothetical protein